jgi:hypothetical protein
VCTDNCATTPSIGLVSTVSAALSSAFLTSSARKR